jgi:hypothetical protein
VRGVKLWETETDKIDVDIRHDYRLPVAGEGEGRILGWCWNR